MRHPFFDELSKRQNNKFLIYNKKKTLKVAVMLILLNFVFTVMLK